MPKTTFYVTVEPRFSSWDPEKITGMTARKITQKRPASVESNAVVVKLTVEIPDEAFEPLRPEAVVQVPVVHTEPVTVNSEPIEVLP